MRKRRELTQSVILAVTLIFSVLISNLIIKGILLLIFSGILIFNILSILKKDREDKYIARVLYGLLLFLVSVLALASVYMIITSFVESL